MDAVKAGTRLKADSGAEVIVLKPPTDSTLAIGSGEPLAIGKRYHCAHCGAEVLVTKAGTAEIRCHGAAMATSEPKKLPSSD